MAVDLTITVEDHEDYDTIELQRASSVNGVYSALTDIELVAGQYVYEYEDASGSASSYYRYRLSTGGADPSEYTNPFKPLGVTRLDIRQYTMEKYRIGMVFESNGGTDPVVSTADGRVISSIHRTDRGKGQWLYIATGARAGTLRRVASSDHPNGDFTVSPTLGGNVASGDMVEWHWITDTNVFNDAINRACRRYWYVDRIALPIQTDNEIDLSNLPWLRTKKQITGLWYYPTSTYEIEYSYGGGGSWWNVREDNGRLVLILSPANTTEIFLEALRTLDPLLTDDSTVPTLVDQDLLAAYTYDEILAYLSRPSTGMGSDVMGWKRERVEHASTELSRLIKLNIPQPRRGVPPTSEPPSFISRVKAR